MTSSPNATTATPAAVEPEALVGALVAVAERSFFAFAEPEGPRARVDEWLGGDRPYEAMVAFRGPTSGQVRLIVPAPLGRDLLSAFLGLDPDEPAADGQIEDLIGEFANMVAGAWLSGLEAPECFALAHPEVQTLSVPPMPFAGVVVQVNGHPVGLVSRIIGSGV